MRTHNLSYGLAVLACLLVLGASGCTDRGIGGSKERFYVIAPEAYLRDRVAVAYNRTGTVHNGDPVEAVEKAKRWVRVRTAHGEEGWIEQYNLVGQPVFDAFQQLHKDSLSRPAQAHAVLRSDFRLHISPSRDADKLFLIKEGAKLDLLERATAPRNPPAKPLASAKVNPAGASESAKAGKGEEEGGRRPTPQKSAGQAKSKSAEKTESPNGKHKKQQAAWNGEELPNSPMEDWWLVRDNQNHTGWVLGHALDVDAPLEIVEYSEGQRIVAAFVLTQVEDPQVDRPNKSIAYYLVLFTPAHDGLPFDYNQARVFTWNLKRHRYETAYREKGIFGKLPVQVGKEDFGKEGVLPTFTLRVQDDDGNTVERKYKMNGVMVKRVAAPDQEQSSGTASQRGAAAHRKPPSM